MAVGKERVMVWRKVIKKHFVKPKTFPGSWKRYLKGRHTAGFLVQGLKDIVDLEPVPVTLDVI